MTKQKKEQLELFDKSFDEANNKIALEDVFEAYYDCRRSKRRTINALAFELDFERELIRLWRELNSGTYKIGRSIAFIVKKPVQREVFAANFRDRIVHHLVINKINQYFEKTFIDSSYSCRQGKGLLYGVRDVVKKIKSCSENYQKECYIMKLDIRSFFMSIDKTILYRLLADFMHKNYPCADKEILLSLIKQIVFYCPENNCVIKGRRSDWNGLPYHKSLFWSEKNRGLPIGNLTSQIFANFYLNQLDQFITQKLKIEYYGRYVDDFIMIHSDKKVLIAAREKIRSFLKSTLNLNLHPQKMYLQEYHRGVSFIGTVIKTNRVYIGNRTKGNLYQRLEKMLLEMAQSLQHTLQNLDSFSSSINSYFGIMRHFNTYRLRSKILQLLNNTFLNDIIEAPQHGEKIIINKLLRPLSQKKRQLQHQKKHHKYRNKQLKLAS